MRHKITCDANQRTEKAKGLQTEICNPLTILVRLAGIEPTTPWFVAKYSIQLSYSRESVDSSIEIFRPCPV